jgi:hypothetical protein
MSITKGNIVTSNDHGTEGLVLAVTRDGKRAKIYVLGSDGVEVWRPIDKVTVTVDGDEQCWKCGGSGIFRGGGMVENGVYKGYSGDCYGCGGKGTQNNADRVRNHHYWHREHSIWMGLDAIEKGETPEPLYRGTYDLYSDRPEASTQVKVPAKKVKIRSKSSAKKNHPDPERKEIGKPRKPRRPAANGTPSPVPGSTLIDCKGCGTLHRDDTMCPW